VTQAWDWCKAGHVFAQCHNDLTSAHRLDFGEQRRVRGEWQPDDDATPLALSGAALWRGRRKTLTLQNGASFSSTAAFSYNGAGTILATEMARS